MSSPSNESGLSARTLAISSVASLTAALVVRQIWGPGAIIGAALTPVIVALVSETLKKPTEKVSTLASDVLPRTRVQRTDRGTRITAPPEPEDRFGIWEESEPRALDRKHVRIGIATGLAAFALVFVLLTSSELIFGGSVSGGGKTTLLGGEKSGGGEERKTAPDTGTEPRDDAPDDPAQTTPPETVPEETTPEEAPPGATPTTPEETTPTAPATPAPDTGGQEAPPG